MSKQRQLLDGAVWNIDRAVENLKQAASYMRATGNTSSEEVERLADELYDKSIAVRDRK